jgi:hypothetical protein
MYEVVCVVVPLEFFHPVPRSHTQSFYLFYALREVYIRRVSRLETAFAELELLWCRVAMPLKTSTAMPLSAIY